MRARAARFGLMIGVVTASWLPVTAVAAIPLQASVTVVVSNGLGGFIHTTPIGGFIIVDVALTFESFGFLDAGNADANTAVDVYVGAVLPDGRFMSWVGDPSAGTFVTAQASVPLVAGVTPTVGTQDVQRDLSSTPPAFQGWCIFYALVVRAGANPLDPAPTSP